MEGKDQRNADEAAHLRDFMGTATPLFDWESGAKGLTPPASPSTQLEVAGADPEVAEGTELSLWRRITQHFHQ